MSNAKEKTIRRIEFRNEDALAEAERQGLMLAAKVRSIALVVILAWVAIDHPGSGPSYLYDLGEVSLFLFFGFLQFVCARRKFYIYVLKYGFVLVDCTLLAVITISPNPFEGFDIPPAIAMNGSQFAYFFVLLMQASFSLLPSLVMWCGVCIAIARLGMLVWFLNQPEVYTNLNVAEPTIEAFVAAWADPNFLYLGFVAIEVIVALIVAAGLAFVARRSRQLVISRSRAERSRASLARYFSPNVVDRLSTVSADMGIAREQPVAVLFADIVGFTKMCEDEAATDVIDLLRAYHDRLGTAVFRHNGKLDKYMGDGLMATFGTPDPTANDAANALQCAIDMTASIDSWNAERMVEGKAPINIGIGVHYGAVIAGDIGNERRLEYSVIGDVVNIASRLEHLTRSLDTRLVVSDDLVRAIDQQTNNGKSLVSRLENAGQHRIRGRDASVKIWTLARDPA